MAEVRIDHFVSNSQISNLLPVRLACVEEALGDSGGCQVEGRSFGSGHDAVACVSADGGIWNYNLKAVRVESSLQRRQYMLDALTNSTTSCKHTSKFSREIVIQPVRCPRFFHPQQKW